METEIKLVVSRPWENGNRYVTFLDGSHRGRHAFDLLAPAPGEKPHTRVDHWRAIVRKIEVYGWNVTEVEFAEDRDLRR